MERNPNDLDSARTGAAGGSGAAGTGAYGSSASGGATTPGSTPSGTTGIGGTAGGYGSMGSTASTPGTDNLSGPADMAGERRGEQMKERAQEGAEAARERLSQAGSRARELKSSVEQKLADRLESGASRLRQRGTSTTSGDVGSPAYAAAGTSTTTAAGDQRMSELQQNVAKGMEKTADWLRNGDMRATIEGQARENPGRTLLVALGVGYLLGKTLRR